MYSKGFTRIAIALAAMVGAYAPAAAERIYLPVPTHGLSAGQEIAPGDFTTKEYEVAPSVHENYLIDLKQALTMVPARSLVAGRPVLLASLRDAPPVRKGHVTMGRFSLDGIEIQTAFEPLQDGQNGERIPCRNTTSGEIVQALVHSDGTLAILEK